MEKYIYRPEEFFLEFPHELERAKIDDIRGNRWFIKKIDKNHVRNEYFAYILLHKLGYNVSETIIVKNGSSKWYHAHKYIERIKIAKVDTDEANEYYVIRGFLPTLMGGFEPSEIIFDVNNKPYIIDNESMFRCRFSWRSMHEYLGNLSENEIRYVKVFCERFRFEKDNMVEIIDQYQEKGLKMYCKNITKRFSVAYKVCGKIVKWY